MWDQMMMWHGDWGPGWAWGWFGLMHILWWVLVILGILALIRWSSRRGLQGVPPPEQDRAIAILRERYARGEIDKTEFEERKRDLGG
jgi:putative membrane protein